MSVFGVFLIRIFPHSDWIRRDMKYLSVFSPNAGKYGPNTNTFRALNELTWGPLNIIITVGKLFNLYAHSLRRFVEYVIYSFMIIKKPLCSKDSTSIWEMFWLENNCSYIATNSILSLLWSFLETKKKRKKFLTSWWSGYEKYFCLL